jgi:hypothetical protein
MATRASERQSKHDLAVHAAAQIYTDNKRHTWINPDGEKNKNWCGKYIDVIAVKNPRDSSAWVIEIETEDSVSDNEARYQWKDYDSVYTKRWYLAVPAELEEIANNLLQKHGIQHCTVTTWRHNTNGTHTFWGLPGLN